MNYITYDPLQFADDGPQQTGAPNRIPPGWVEVKTGYAMAGDYRWDGLSGAWIEVISGRDGYPASNYYCLIRRDPNTVAISAVEPAAEAPPEPVDEFRLNTRAEMAEVCAALRDGVPCQFRRPSSFWYPAVAEHMPNFEDEQWRVKPQPTERTATPGQLVDVVKRAFNVLHVVCVMGSAHFKIDGLAACINQSGVVSVKLHHWVKDDTRTKYVKRHFDAVMEGR